MEGPEKDAGVVVGGIDVMERKSREDEGYGKRGTVLRSVEKEQWLLREPPIVILHTTSSTRDRYRSIYCNLNAENFQKIYRYRSRLAGLRIHSTSGC